MSGGKTVGSIEMAFGTWTRGVPKNRVLDGARIPSPTERGTPAYLKALALPAA